MSLRRDPPVEIFYPVPEAIIPDEQYLVCYRNGSQEIVVQSDRTPERAEYSVNVLNEHEVNNARPAKHYWRERKPGEATDLRRDRVKRHPRYYPYSYA